MLYHCDVAFLVEVRPGVTCSEIRMTAGRLEGFLISTPDGIPVYSIQSIEAINSPMGFLLLVNSCECWSENWFENLYLSRDNIGWESVPSPFITNWFEHVLSTSWNFC